VTFEGAGKQSWIIVPKLTVIDRWVDKCGIFLDAEIL
jgi:hypothetical protein